MKPIRNSAKAIIIKNGKLLLTKNKDDFGFFYLFPGGGQEHGENLHQALKRECMEEISAEIEIKDILFIRDYIGKNHEFSEWDMELHQVEFMFECVLLNENQLKNGNVPDSDQIGFEWIKIEELSKYRIYPSILKKYIGNIGKEATPVYLGDTN